MRRSRNQRRDAEKGTVSLRCTSQLPSQECLAKSHERLTHSANTASLDHLPESRVGSVYASRGVTHALPCPGNIRAWISGPKLASYLTSLGHRIEARRRCQDLLVRSLRQAWSRIALLLHTRPRLASQMDIPNRPAQLARCLSLVSPAFHASTASLTAWTSR